ncbi:MAG: ABC transporter permease [Chloroflexi bacterium]|nr:ABC transporter permease [Chloroflexota bacterium]
MARPRRSILGLARLIVIDHWGATFGGAILAAVVLAAVLAEWLAPSNPIVQNLGNRLAEPSWLSGGSSGHLLGTDQLGRDVLSRLIWGARVSLSVGVAAVLIAGASGIVLGLVSGYYGGLWDHVIMRLADIRLAFPFVMLALLVVAAFGPGIEGILVVLGGTGWVVYARLVRGEVLSLREREFVLASRAIGAGAPRIMRLHILPNVMTPVIVVASLQLAEMIVAEAALSFLGLGVRAPEPSWGSMLADGRTYIARAWWLATFPGIAISLTVLAANTLGDWVRDQMDPRMRGRTPTV